MGKIGLILILLFANSCNFNNLPSNKTKLEIVCFDDFDTSILPYLKLDIEKFYEIKTVLTSKNKIPNNCFYKPRNRFRADSIIQFLNANKNQKVDLVLGLCSKDISVSIHNANDWGVFGFGYCPGNSCVASSFRLKKDTKPGYYTRLKNVVLHELGHNLGLVHCQDTICLMVDAKGKMSSIEGTNRKLCVNCQQFIDGK